jgi:hypothetical protein
MEEFTMELNRSTHYLSARLSTLDLDNRYHLPSHFQELELHRNGLNDAKVVSYTSGSTNFLDTWLGNSLAELQGIKPSQEELVSARLSTLDLDNRYHLPSHFQELELHRKFFHPLISEHLLNFLDTWLGNSLAELQGIKPSQEELVRRIMMKLRLTLFFLFK